MSKYHIDHTNNTDNTINTDNTNNVVYVFKPIGMTPLDVINELYTEEEQNQMKEEGTTISYAGRLDPLACGILPIVFNDTNKTISKSIHESNEGYKEYHFTFVVCGNFGNVRTDTGDIMGLIDDDYFPEHVVLNDTSINAQNINDCMEPYINDILGMTEQPYPIYSSKTVRSEALKIHGITKKKPLWLIARDYKDCLPSYNDLPKREVNVDTLEILENETMNFDNFYKEIETRINMVGGKFRQKEILDKWKAFGNDDNNININIHKIRMRAVVSNGTYIRGICHRMGGIAMDITRTMVGTKRIDDVDKYKRFHYFIVY